MLGCTNYKRDGTGCSRVMTPKYFYEYMHISDVPPADPVVIPKGSDIKPKASKAKTAPEVQGEKHIQTPELKKVDYDGLDLNVTLVTILNTLSNVSRKKYYGITMQVDILRGSQNRRLVSDGLDKIDGYGKLSHVKREDVQFLVEWLIENEYIRQTKGPYPVLHPTYNGEHYDEVITRQKLLSLMRTMKTTS